MSGAVGHPAPRSTAVPPAGWGNPVRPDGGMIAGTALAAGIFADLLLAMIGSGGGGGVLVMVGSAAAALGIAALMARGPAAAIDRAWRPALGGMLLAGWFAFTLLWSTEPAYGAEKLTTMVFKAGGFGLLLLGMLGPRRRMRFEPLLAISLALPLLAVIAGGEAADSPGRWTILGMNPIWTARMAWITVLVAMIGSGSPVWLRIAAGAGGAVVGFATGSRGPFVAFLAIVFIWWLIIRPSTDGRRWGRFRLALQALVVAGLVLATQFGNYEQQLGTAGRLRMEELGGDRNVVARIALQSSALEQFASRPVLGVGLGSLAHESWQRYPHNLPIEILAETGLVGITISGLLLLAATRRGRQFRQLGAITLLTVFFSLTSGDVGGNWLIWYLAAVMSASPAGEDA